MDLLKTIWQCGCKVYTDKRAIDLGTTEYKIYRHNTPGGIINILAIRGTDEIKDHKKNVNLWSIYGYKKTGVEAAEEIKNKIWHDRRGIIIDYVVVHSKSAITGDYFTHKYKDLFKIKQCCMFNPARGRRYWNREYTDMITMFINKRDPVSQILGFINFGLPKCKTHVVKGNSFWYSAKKNHSIKLWENLVTRLSQEISLE